jgi:hypothetical protein
MKERGLVDDVMVAIASPASVPPLLETLDRFERMSNHRMNVDKTMLLLLGTRMAASTRMGTRRQPRSCGAGGSRARTTYEWAGP